MRGSAVIKGSDVVFGIEVKGCLQNVLLAGVLSARRLVTFMAQVGSGSKRY